MDQSTNPDEKRRLDPVRTRERILEAAVATFAERGYAGASIGDIANAAGVPKGLVAYHFGCKEDLWQASLADRLAPMMEAYDRVLSGAESDFRALARVRLGLLRKHPELARLLAWASISEVPSLPGASERKQSLLRRFSEPSQRAELLRLMMGISALDGWFLFRDLHRSRLGEEVFAEEARVLEEFVAALGTYSTSDQESSSQS